MQSITVNHPADVAYVEENFATLEAICARRGADATAVREDIAAGRRPAASYVLHDGREFFPADYLSLETDRARFEERIESEARAQGLPAHDFADAWDAYLTGVFGVCLRTATPENIVRKAALLQRIETLIAHARENDPGWVRDLRCAVDALDDLERPFSEHYDRERFGRPPTRDSHIAQVRARYPAICPTPSP